MAFWKKILSARGGKKPAKPKLVKEEPAEIVEKEVVVGAPESGGKSKIPAGVILSPHITEKASNFSSNDKYVFKVSGAANKIQIKDALEAKYNVAIKSVRVINLPGKERRRGRIIGFKPGFKKAIVTLREGQSIELT